MNEDGLQFERIYLWADDYETDGDGPVLWTTENDDGAVEYVNVAAFDAQAHHIGDLEAALREKDWAHAETQALLVSHEGHIEGLNAKLAAALQCVAELEAQLQSFKDFNAPLLEMIAEEEPGAWNHLQEEAKDD